MKTYNNLYFKIYLFKNLVFAWREARKHKTRKLYVIKFEQNTRENLLKLHEELKNQTYSPEPLKTFILRDPKTRKISKSAFRDRIVHHALVNTLEPIFDKTFIYDNCASRKGKGTLFALKRFEFIEVDLDLKLKDLKEEFLKKLKGKINGTEVALSIASGDGKEHMALISALLSVPAGVRFVALTKDGIVYL